MVDSETKIQQAFVNRYQTLSPMPDTLYENRPFSDVRNSDIYVGLNFLPSVPDYPFLGSDAEEHVAGFFSFTVYNQTGSGWKAVHDLGDKIKTLFQRNTVLSYSDVTFKVIRSFKLKSDKGDGAYQLPVLVEYEGWL